MTKLMAGLSLVAVLAAGCGQGEGEGSTPQGQPEAPEGPQEVTVTAVEYEFQGVPENLEAGRVRFVMENQGQEQHEMTFALVKSDATLEELLELPEKQVNKHIEDAGRLFARPGDSQRRVLDLSPGRYAYVCFVTTKDGTPHAFEGMVGELTVA